VAGLADIGMASGHPLDVTDPESFATFLDKARTDGAAMSTCSSTTPG
jgi:hypothetical protein